MTSDPFTTESTVVGVIGLGNMGSPMARHLIESGYSVLVQDQRPDVARLFAAEHGGSSVETGAELAEQSSVIITMLPNGSIVTEVLLGLLANGSGPLASLANRGVVIDMSSSEPQGTVTLGKKLAEYGVPMLDAPVSGGVARAQTGTLSILVGGDTELAARAEPVLAALGSTIHVGHLGAGHAVKALNNMLSAVGLIASGEALLVGQRFGIEPRVMLSALNSSTGRNNSTENKVEQFVFSGTYASGFSLDLMVKDLKTALALAEQTGTPAALGEQATRTFIEAQKTLPAGSDHTSVVRWLAESLDDAWLGQ